MMKKKTQDVSVSKLAASTISQQITDFISSLQQAARGQGRNTRSARADLAILRRAMGKSLAYAGDALIIFFRYAPLGVAPFREESFFLIGTLFAFYPCSSSLSFGESLALLQHASSGASEVRIRQLLRSDMTHGIDLYAAGRTGHHLCQIVRLMKRYGIVINYAALLTDLLYWHHPAQFVQLAWAKSLANPKEKLSSAGSSSDDIS